MQSSQKTYTAGGVTFPGAPIMIGAGLCKTIEDTRQWIPYAPVVSGTYPRTAGEFTIQEQFTQLAKDVETIEERFPLIISVGGDTVAHYVDGVKALSSVSRVAAIELNVSRPETSSGRIFSFNLEALDELLRAVIAVSGQKPLWVKVSPYSDPFLLKEVAGLINGFKGSIHAVTSCNMLQNVYGSPRKYALLSGPLFLDIALGQVMQFREHLDDAIDVIGSGGVTTGNDVCLFLEEGAKAVQLMTMPYELGDPTKFWPMLLKPDTSGRLRALLA